MISMELIVDVNDKKDQTQKCFYQKDANKSSVDCMNKEQILNSTDVRD